MSAKQSEPGWLEHVSAAVRLAPSTMLKRDGGTLLSILGQLLESCVQAVGHWRVAGKGQGIGNMDKQGNEEA